MFRHCFRSVLLVKKFEKLGESAKFGSPDVLNKMEMQMLKRVTPSAPKETPKEKDTTKRGSVESRPMYPVLDLAPNTA